MQFERVIDTPIGKLTLCADETGICELKFGMQSTRTDDVSMLDQAQQELEEYFAGRRKLFSVPLSIHGTPFQESVWRALIEVPYGETISYGELARRVNNPKACRAVGMANHVNRIPIFIPCHRVVGANGKLTGYAGGLEIKRMLLKTEGIDVKV